MQLYLYHKYDDILEHKKYYKTRSFTNNPSQEKNKEKVFCIHIKLLTLTMSLPKSSCMSMKLLVFVLLICKCSKVSNSEDFLYAKVCARTSFEHECRLMLRGCQKCVDAKDMYELAYGIIEASQKRIKSGIDVFRYTMSLSHEVGVKQKLEECITAYTSIYETTEAMQNFVKDKRRTLVTTTASSNKGLAETCETKIGKIFPTMSESSNGKMKKYYQILELVGGEMPNEEDDDDSS